MTGLCATKGSSSSAWAAGGRAPLACLCGLRSCKACPTGLHMHETSVPPCLAPATNQQRTSPLAPGLACPRSWKIQVRKVLSGDKVFEHTGMKQKHETVWRLNQVWVGGWVGGGVGGGQPVIDLRAGPATIRAGMHGSVP